MRRVITGYDDNGKSTVVYDGPAQSIFHVTNTDVNALTIQHVSHFIQNVEAGQTCVADIWETNGKPTATDADPMATPQKFTIQPDSSGLRVRYHVWGSNLHSAMHATDTLDINVIVAGEVTLLLEEARSVSLGAGDSVVLPGIAHGWQAGPQGVTMVNIMQRLASTDNSNANLAG